MLGDIVIWLSLWMILAVCCSSLVLIRRMRREQQAKSIGTEQQYIDSLERQIRENNQDITTLGGQLSLAQKRLAQPAPLDDAETSGDSALHNEIATLRTRISHRDQQISSLHMDLSRFQGQRAILEEKNAIIAEQAKALDNLTRQLTELRAELARFHNPTHTSD